MQHNKKGFTLVELLVVLVIIGILAAVATPIYLANTRRAKMSEAIATMSLIRQAQRDYQINNNTFYDVIRDTGKSNTSGNIQNPPPSSVVATTKAPTPATAGVGVNVGVGQYFYNGAFNVQADSTQATLDGFSRSGLFTTPGVQGFLISMRGEDNYQCAAATDSNCAINGNQVNVSGLEYAAEMDNSGRIFVCYQACDTATNWSSY